MNAKNPKADDHHLNPASLPQVGKGKEVEADPTAQKEEDKIMAEISTTADALDREALSRARESFAEIKRSVPEPDLPPDVEDAGVKVPARSAEEVVTKGATITLGTSENIYKKGLHTKIVGHVKDKVVIGVSSLAALAFWIGRLVKIAHKHAMKVVFRNAG